LTIFLLNVIVNLTLKIEGDSNMAQLAELHSLLEISDFDSLVGTPWESVGHKICSNATIPEILKAADLNWHVVKYPTFIEVPHKTKKLKINVPDSYALVRSSDNKILSPYMGKRYKPVQNDQAFEVFVEFVMSGGMTMETAGYLNDGQHIWVLASINKTFSLNSNETIKGYLLLVQSHLYGYSLRAMFTPIRFPGGHTLVQNINIGNSKGTYRMPHSRVFNEARIEEIKSLVSQAKYTFDDFTKKATFLANTNLTEEDGVLVLSKIFDPNLLVKSKETGKRMPRSINELMNNDDANRVVKKAVEVMNSYPGRNLSSCQGTAWGYYNGIVHAFDSVMGHNVNTRLESAWLGKNANKKLEAFDILITKSAMVSTK
jgi:phage/plasmid-like protein (TIGR03299 family)